MRKKITLLFLMVISLDIYSQVVIKDEIILDVTTRNDAGTEGAGLTMPFYGKVEERVYAWSIACSYARRELIIDGVNYPFGPCWDWECGVGQCFCSTGYNYKLVEDVPEGASIDTRLQKCRNWGPPGGDPTWGDMQYYFELFSVTQTKHTYYVYARYTKNDPYQLAAYVYLTKTTIPPCDDSPTCCSDIPFCENFETPQNLYISKSPGYKAYFTETYYETLNPCADGKHSCITDGGMAATDMAPFHFVDGFEWNLQPCTNPLNDKVYFNYSILLNGIPESRIPLVYVIEFCPNNCNPPKTWIEDTTDLKNKISTDNVCTILNDICNHFGNYPVPAKFLLREVTEIHENNHLLDFQFKMIIYNTTKLYPKMKKVETDCYNYLLNPEEELRKAERKYENIISEHINFVKKEYLRTTNELYVQSRANIFNKVREYYLVANRKKKQLNITCSQPVCKNIGTFTTQ